MLIVGLMSGTSADGVDAALVSVTGKARKISATLVQFITEPYSTELRRRALDLCSPGGGSTAEVAELNVIIGERFAHAALSVCGRASVSIEDVSIIGSHGQTVAHLPEKGATLQIGEPAVIAELTGRPVVADFRPADMAAGGQGAPLTPLADFLLLRNPEKNRAIVNIGGISNITFLPAGIEDPEKMIAFDTGPGNMLLDAMTSIITKGAGKFDRDGAIARSGNVRDQWLKEMLRHPFFKTKPPKSAGREQFGVQYLNELIARFKVKTSGARKDLLATLTVLTARSIAEVICKFHKVDELLACGGGASNAYLMELLENEIRPIRLGNTGDAGVPADAREAMAFALLARETWEGRPGNVMSVTGASRHAILGKTVRP